MTSGTFPAWSLPADAEAHLARRPGLPGRITPELAWGGSDGSGVRVCVLDSGVDAEHPLVAPVAERWGIAEEGDGNFTFAPDEGPDSCGHGTACCGVVRRLAPGCEIVSVKVLPDGFTGSAMMMLAGIQFAIERGFEVVNMSLSTSRPEFVAALHDLCDRGYFGRTLLVASAHNMPVESYPWRFASVVSVGSHERDDPELVFVNPEPPVEFFARGVAVEVPWPGGGTGDGDRQLVRHPPRRRAVRAHPRQAPRPRALPGEGGAGRRRRQRAAGPMSADDLRAAVAAAALGAEEGHAEVLEGIVHTARAIFGARAASVMLLDEPAGELVFRAVSGEGEADLVGRRFPAGAGIAGFTLVSRQPLVLDDVSQDPRFSREAAESTGYVPRGLMSVPLLRGERAIGVLQVLDRAAGRFGLQGDGAPRPLRQPGRGGARRAGARADGRGRCSRGDDDRLAAVARVAEALDGLEGRRGEAAERLLAALADVLATRR